MQGAGTANSQREVPLVQNAAQVCLRPSLKRFFLLSAVPGQFPLFLSVASSFCCLGALTPAECSSSEPFFSGDGLWEALERIFTGSLAVRRLSLTLSYSLSLFFGTCCNPM